MKKPILVVMAAGMGSRYGGLKQLDPVGPTGELIIDYSIFDARRAGFESVVFIIKREIEDAFKEAIGNRLSKFIDVRYAFQQIGDLPEGYEMPSERTKPWGTAHAVRAARTVIDAPFVVINADDYYGRNAFQTVYDYLSTPHNDTPQHHYAMVGYLLKNTVTEHGHVARGVCQVDDTNNLTEVCEYVRIEKQGDSIACTEDEGNTWKSLSDDTVVSMNLWGFEQNFLQEIDVQFPAFLDNALSQNPTKAEFFLPSVVSTLIQENKAQVKVLTCDEKWYGVTYQQDKPVVVSAIADKIKQGLYPANLWEANV